MTIGRLVELVLAVILLGTGLWFYTRRPAGGVPEGERRDSQGSVILFVVAVIMGIHALGGLDYHPTQLEIDAARAQ